MRLALFDLDHTLLTDDSDFLWGQFLCDEGHVDRDEYEQANQAFYQQYLDGSLDMLEFCAFALRPLAAHDPTTLYAWREQFMRERIEPIVAPGAPALLAEHRAAGDTLLITSATNRFVTEPIAKLLGVDHLIATDIEQVDGRYTGKVSGQPNFKGGKVTRLRAWLESQPMQYERMIAYSDSHNDIPLLEMADEAVAVDADRQLREVAQQRGWRVISLRG